MASDSKDSQNTVSESQGSHDIVPATARTAMICYQKARTAMI